MKLKYLLLIIPILVGYIIGHIFPIDLFMPKFEGGQEFDKAEYYRFIMSVLSALITGTAVIVALFKDDFREMWKKPKIDVNFQNGVREVFNDESESNSSSDPLIASKYISKIEILNNGNLASLNTEIFLEKLEYKEKESSIIHNIDCTGKALDWNGTDSNNIILPVGSKKSLDIVIITAPEKVSKPDAPVEKKNSTIIFGDVECSKEHNKGVWYATFTIYSQNHKPKSFKIEMEWNGVWKTRLSDFNSYFTIKLTK